MGTISLTLPIAGTGVTAGLHATNYTTLLTVINGGLDNNNINGGAAIAQSKLAFDNWASYVPVWSSSGVAPVLGNGTISGLFAQLGKTVVGKIILTMGSTTTFGTGTYAFSLPVTASAGETGTLGVAEVNDASPSGAYGNFARLATTTTFDIRSPAAPSVLVGATSPITFAVGDLILARFFYQAA